MRWTVAIVVVVVGVTGHCRAAEFGTDQRPDAAAVSRARDLIAETIRATAVPQVPLSRPDSAPALTPWPITDTQTDRVPPGLRDAAHLESSGPNTTTAPEYAAQVATSAESGRCFASEGVTPEQKLESCTAVIQSPGQTREVLVAAYVNRGFNYDNKGEHDRAIVDFDEAIRLNPQYALAYNNRGVAYNGKGSYDRALLDLDEAIRLNPKLTNAYAARGWAYTGKGSYDRAIADLDEAIRLDPKYAKAYNRRGLAYSSKGEHDRAIVDFDEAIRLDPKLALAYNGRGFVYASKRDYPRAIADYDQALILDPSLAVARQNRQLAQTAINPWQKLERPVTQGKAVLYDEDQAKLNGTQFVASAVWSTEGVAPGPGQQPAVVLRAEVEIPELKVRCTSHCGATTTSSLPRAIQSPSHLRCRRTFPMAVSRILRAS
jgi:tetratricopeptide (TPR) repeat protein